MFDAKPPEILDTVLTGDSWTLAKTLPSNIVQTIVTSPPYFGHRQYATAEALQAQEFGRETDPQDYVTKLVALFDELKRVLLPNGTLWLNLGDTYRQGQLLGIPWRIALALQARGWLLKSEIIWNKPNAMPSSVKKRPTTAHEHIFLLSQAADYYYDADAIREPHVTFSENSKMRGVASIWGHETVRQKMAKIRVIPISTMDAGIRHFIRWGVINALSGKCRLANFGIRILRFSRSSSSNPVSWQDQNRVI